MKIFVYTDGVPEATSVDNELFGTDRMLSELEKSAAADPRGILENMHAAVDGFQGEREAFDDVTMLCVEYRGSENKEA